MNTSSITRFASRSKLKLVKHSPQILFYSGIVGTVATTVLASRATLRAVPVMQSLEYERTRLDAAAASPDTIITDDQYTQEVVRQYTVTSVQLTKLYGPSVIVGVASIAALTKSHRQLTSRNAALTTAFTGLFKTFEGYRSRVRAELGDDIDRQFLHGTVQTEIESVDGNGKIKTKTVNVLDAGSNASGTAWFSKETSTNWVKDPSYNQNHIQGQEDWCNLLLQRQGHLFLNEVYDLLGMKHTREGAIVGWIFRDMGDNDNFVSFGHTKDGEFIAGYTKDVLLDFNTHGPILDLI